MWVFFLCLLAAVCVTPWAAAVDYCDVGTVTQLHVWQSSSPSHKRATAESSIWGAAATGNAHPPVPPKKEHALTGPMRPAPDASHHACSPLPDRPGDA